jgi:hypothetical protein
LQFRRWHEHRVGNEIPRRRADLDDGFRSRRAVRADEADVDEAAPLILRRQRAQTTRPG